MSSAREILTKLLSNVIGRRDSDGGNGNGGNGPRRPTSSSEDRIGKILNVHLNEQCMFAQNQSGGSSSNLNLHLQTENHYHNPLLMDNMNVSVNSLHPGLADLLNKFGANVPRHNGTNPNFHVSAAPARDVDDSDREEDGGDDFQIPSDDDDQGGENPDIPNGPNGLVHRHTSTLVLRDGNKCSDMGKSRSCKRAFALTPNQMEAEESNAPTHKVAKTEKPNQTATRPPLRRSSNISPITFAQLEHMEKLDKTSIQVDTCKADKAKIIEDKDFMSTTAFASSESSSSAEFLGNP